MRAAIYARYSSDNQREESLEDQIRACTKYAKSKNMIIDPKYIYTDSATSGRVKNRPGLIELMRCAQERKFDIVIVDDLSRLSRDASATLKLADQFEYWGVFLHSIGDGIDTSRPKSKLSLQLRAIINDNYIDALRDSTIRGLSGQKERGYFVAEATFGYKSIPDGEIKTDKKGRQRPDGYKMEIVSEEADIVIRIFNDYSRGKSISRITKELNEEGLSSRKHFKNGWKPSTIHRILKNEKYIGKWVWGKRMNKRDPLTGSVRQVIRADGPLHEGYHEDLRIVPQEVWDTVQAKFKLNEKTWPKAKRQSRFCGEQSSYVTNFPRELLSGAMFCNVCGEVIGKVSGKAGGYYGCMKAKQNACSNKVIVRKSVAEKIILTELKKNSLTRRILITYLKRLRK